MDDQVKKDDSDIYDLDENNYVVDREPAVLYTAKKDDQLFSSKILCPKMLLSKCFNAISSSNSYTNNSCLYNRILESDNLKLKQNHEKNDAAAAAALSQNGEPNIKAASSISDVVHQKKEVNAFVVGSGGSKTSSTSGYLLDKNFKFIFIGLAIVFLVSLTSLCLTVYVLIKRRNHVLYQPTEGYPHDER